MNIQKITKTHLFPKGFTLVELIVVITILAILGTIGFLAIGGYSSRARDSERTSDMVNISKGFEVLLAKGTTLPLPDAEMITLTASGTTIGYQGYAGARTLSNLWLWGKFQDPITGDYYTYATNAIQNKYQILGLLENSDNLSLALGEIPGISTAYANNYEKRFPLTKGTSLGILVGTWANINQPIQKLYNAASFTGVDVVTTGTGYVAVFGKDNILSGTGFVLRSMRAGGELANGLVGYWTFDEASGNSVLDSTGNGGNATLTGTSLPTRVAGKIWNGIQLWGNQLISGPNIKTNGSYISASALVRLTTTGSGVTIATQSRGCQDGASPYRGNAWSFSINNNGNISLHFNKLGNHFHPNVTITSNLRITDLDYHFVAFSFNYGKVQINLDNQVENIDIGAVDFLSPTIPNGVAGRKYNTLATLPLVSANFYDYTGNDWSNYLEGNRLRFTQFLTPEINVSLGWQAVYCWWVYTYGLSYGILDEVRIYNRALSAGEMQSLFNSTK